MPQLEIVRFQHLDDQPVANQVKHFAILNRVRPCHLAVPDYVSGRALVQDREEGAA